MIILRFPGRQPALSSSLSRILRMMDRFVLERSLPPVSIRIKPLSVLMR